MHVYYMYTIYTHCLFSLFYIDVKRSAGHGPSPRPNITSFLAERVVTISPEIHQLAARICK